MHPHPVYLSMKEQEEKETCSPAANLWKSMHRSSGASFTALDSWYPVKGPALLSVVQNHSLEFCLAALTQWHRKLTVDNKEHLIGFTSSLGRWDPDRITSQYIIQSPPAGHGSTWVLQAIKATLMWAGAIRNRFREKVGGSWNMETGWDVDNEKGDKASSLKEPRYEIGWAP